MKEIWKPVLGFESKYEASNTGLIRNKNRGNILTPKKGKGNYLFFSPYLSDKKKTVTYYIHRAIWEAFNGTIPNDLEINHLNENKSDNSLNNLSIVTRKENVNWGTHAQRVGQKLKNGPCSKPIIQLDKQGNLIKEWPSISEANRCYGTAVNDCLYGRRPSAYGFIWKNKEC